MPNKFLLLVVIAALSACDGFDNTDQANTDKIYNLRFGHDMPVDSAHHTAAVKFAQLVGERSKGKIKIDIHPEQSLGNDHEMIEMAQAGELDIILPPTAKLSTLSPAFQIIDIPFIFHHHDEAYQVLDGKGGQSLLKKLQVYGLTGISFWESGFKQLTLDRPLPNNKALQGLKFRVMRSSVLKDQFNSWGADTIAIDFSRTRQALADGIVNGQENPLGSIYNMKFHEVQSHLLLTNHGYLAQVLVVSNKTLERLPANLQDIIINTGIEVTAFQREESRQRDKTFLNHIKQSKINISEPEKSTLDKLKQQTLTVLEKNRMAIGTDIVELTLQALGEIRGVDTNKLVIALDADLAGNSSISGMAIRRGIELAINEVNTSGGVLGKKLQLIARDNSMVSARGIHNLNYFSKIPNLVAVFGGISSPVVLSELELIHRKKLLFLDPWAAATDIINNNYSPNYVFRVSVRDEYAAKFLLKKALTKSSKPALLFVNNGWGRSNYSAIKAEMSRLNITPAIEQWFDWGDKKLDEKLSAISNSGAGVIIYVGNVIEASKLIKYIDNKKLTIPIVSHWGITGGDLPKLSGESLNNVDITVLQTFSFINNKKPKTKKVLKLYKRLYSIDDPRQIPAPVGTAHAYDLTHLLVKAIKMSGKTDMPSIRNAMEKLGTYKGLVRTYQPAFTKRQHDALKQDDYFLARYQDGILVPVKN